MSKVREFRVSGIPLLPFVIIAIVIATATFMNVLPGGMVGAFPIMIVIGAILNELGNRTPIIKDYLGGGPIVVIFGTAALFTYNVLPESAGKVISDFTKSGGFLTFYIAALITGSILGMERKLLLKAAVRFFLPIFAGLIAAFLLVGIGGMLIDYGFSDAILYIATPIMGGGMGAGAVPMSEIFAEKMNSNPEAILSLIVPALALGNAMSILAAGVLDRIGKVKPSLTGNGKLMVAQNDDIDVSSSDQIEPLNYEHIGLGIVVATSFIVFGRTLSKFLPIHYYALTIISVALVKILNIAPPRVQDSASHFYKVIAKNLTPALLVGIGVAYTDLTAVINAISIQYVLLVLLTIVGAIFGAGLVGKLVGFYFVESAITAGLCMANMGGTGDVAVLSSSKRMELMPFAQISSRIGGAIMILLATALISIFG